jgi:hypothetical protein
VLVYRPKLHQQRNLLDDGSGVARSSPNTQQASATVIHMAQPRTVRSEKAPAELLSFRISAEQRKQLDKAAKQRKQSVSEIIRSLISEQLTA